MNIENRLEAQKRINRNLEAELLKIKAENDTLIEQCMEPDIRVAELIDELTQLKNEWDQALIDIDNEREEYRKLNKELRDLRDYIKGNTKIQRKLFDLFEKKGD